MERFRGGFPATIDAKKKRLLAFMDADVDHLDELALAEKVAAQPLALIHRDFQSQNILTGGDSVGLVDFQGMRWGPVAYDAVSLKVDPKTPLDYAKPAGDIPAAEQRLGFDLVNRLNKSMDRFNPLFDELGITIRNVSKITDQISSQSRDLEKFKSRDTRL